MKYLLLALVFFCFGTFNGVFGQEDKFVQDFRKQFNNIKTDTARLTFLDNLENKIAYFQNPILSEEILSFANRSIPKLNSTPHYKGLAYGTISNYHLAKNDLNKVILYSDSALIFLKEEHKYKYLYAKAQALVFIGKSIEGKAILFYLIKQKNIEARTRFTSNRMLAKIYVENSNFDSAYLFLNELDRIVKEEKKEEYRISILDIKFILYNRLNKQDSVFYAFKEIEAYRIKTNDKDNLAKAYTNIGNVFNDYGKYDEALEYYKKSIVIKEELGSKNVGYTYYNIATLLENKGEDKYKDKYKYQKEVMYYLKKSITSYQEAGDLEGIAYSKESLAFNQTQLKFKQNSSDYTEEINMAKEAFEFFKKQNSYEMIVGSGSYLCQILVFAGKIQEAAQLLEELNKYPEVGLFTKIRLKYTEIKVQMALQNIDIKHIEKIGSNLNEILNLQDSLGFLSYDKEIPRKLAELEAERAKSDKKQQELETQLTKQELKTSQLTTWSIFGIAFLLIAILIVLFFVRNQRAKRKQAELEVQNQSEQRKVAELETQNQIEQKKVIELELANQSATQKEIELQTKNREIAYNLEKTTTEMEARITEERNQVATKAFGDMAYHIHTEAGGTLTLAIEELTTLSNQKEAQKALKALKHLKEDFRNITRIFENFEEITTLQFRLEQYNRLIAKNNPAIFFEYHIEIPQLTTDIKGDKAKHIYFVIQEFIHNAIKYAEASKISVVIEIEEDNLLIKVIDDGKGFDVETTKTSGLRLNINKIQEIGGNVIIHSSDKGTQIEMRFPNTKENNKMSRIVKTKEL